MVDSVFICRNLLYIVKIVIIVYNQNKMTSAYIWCIINNDMVYNN